MTLIDDYLLRKQVVIAGFVLDASSAALTVGDWFCVSPADVTGNTVTKAVAAALAAAGGPLAIAIESAQPGQPVRGIPIGMVPNAITGLGAGTAGPCRVNTTTARTERGAIAATDYVVGFSDTSGALTIAPARGSAVYLPSLALAVKKPVRCVAARPLPANTRAGNVITITANGAFSAVDSVTLALNERILLAGEAAGANNGIYYLSRQGDGSTQAQLTRDTDADESSELAAGLIVRVQEGLSFAGSAWQLVTPGAITLNTTALDWVLTEVATRVAKFSSTNSSNTYEDVTALDYTIPEGYLVTVQFDATGHQAATPKVARYRRLAEYYRRVGESTVVMTSTTVLKNPDEGAAPFEDDLDWDARIAISVDDLTFQLKQDGENPGAKWDCRVSIVAIPLPT